jgi:hypothetical protein
LKKTLALAHLQKAKEGEQKKSEKQSRTKKGNKGARVTKLG